MAREMLERAGVEDAESYTSGDLVEIANIIHKTLFDALDRDVIKSALTAFSKDQRRNIKARERAAQLVTRLLR